YEVQDHVPASEREILHSRCNHISCQVRLQDLASAAMTTKLGYVTIDCADARSLAPFWASALGWETTYEADDGAVLADPGGADPKLFLQVVPEPKSGKNRAHV